MTSSIKAGAVYFLIVFLVAFALGTSRVLLIAPRIGEVAAVLAEAPLILTVSWFASRWCTGRFGVRAGVAPRLAMGGLAFALLIVAEVGLSAFAFNRSVADQIAAYRSLAAQLGLAAQVLFALTPLAQLRRSGA